MYASKQKLVQEHLESRAAWRTLQLVSKRTSTGCLLSPVQNLKLALVTVSALPRLQVKFKLCRPEFRIKPLYTHFRCVHLKTQHGP